MSKLSIEQGQRAVELARETLEDIFIDVESDDVSKDGFLQEKRGVFTTLKKEGELQGCIGFPKPVMELGKAIEESTIKAATDDPRFKSLKEEDVKNTTIELSILTEPEEIDYEDNKELLEKIEVGKDGLIVSSGFRTGLLLPQVAVDNGWDVEEFLSQTCRKAGLEEDAWRDRNLTVKKFQAQIFKEDSPEGEIYEE